VREAMILGIPVVAAAAEGTVESLDGYGWLIDPDDDMAAAAAVAEVLDDDVRRRLICADARRSALARFSVEGMVEATLGVYARCRYGTAAGAAVTRKFACCVH